MMMTTNHRVFTQKGWIKACNLTVEHYIISTNEAMSLLRETIQPETASTGLRNLPCEANANLCLLRESIYGQDSIRNEAFLRSEMLREMDMDTAGHEGKGFHQGKGEKSFGIKKALVGVAGGGVNPETKFRLDEKEQSDAQRSKLSEGGCLDSSRWMSPAYPGGQWHRTKQGGMATNENVPGSNLELSSENIPTQRKRVSLQLQARLSVPKSKIGNRSRRPITQQSVPKGERFEENHTSQGSWVESVEILKPGHPKFPSSKENSERCSVYNLEVKRHPSYTVNGFLVHNCAPTFLDCLPNLRSNTGSGGLKVIASGNPKHDPNDQLGMVAEPLEGWSAKDGIDKTEVWPIKLSGGVCVNLIGTDSPNFDQPEDKYPGLIGHEFEKIMAHDYGVNSYQYETQVRGRMRIGLEHSRVITRQFCRLHGAH
jgi:hypothetical protein